MTFRSTCLSLASAVLLASAARAQTTCFVDDFEATTLDPFWTTSAVSGSITFPSSHGHTGNQAVRFDSVVSAANKSITLRHNFPQPIYGRVSVWMDDTGATAGSSNYMGINTNDFAIYVFDYNLSLSNGGAYVYNVGGLAHHSAIPRTQTWHLFAIDSTPAGLTLWVDGIPIHTGPAVALSHVELFMSGPNWRPAWTTSFDDFTFIPYLPSSYALFGSGCPGSVGTPTIQAPAVGPSLGTSFDVTVTSLPFTSAAVGILGASNTRLANGMPLPVSLDFLGMRGCQLNVSTELFVFLGQRPTPDTAIWSLPIPQVCDLFGATFYQQVMVTDPPANALGIIMSNAGQATIGS
ncbi:MAG: hypothetical protein R3F56_05690 [Planctomycetota bacterium]